MRELPARYQFLRRLGSGAAGGVFLVQDRLHGGAPIALKRLEPGSDPAFRSSFAREFGVLASLSLPGLAQVYDLGVMPFGHEMPEGPFFTRAFVDGQPLDEWARSQELERVASLFVGALDVVSGLHRVGIVHGDLKPANVIIDAAEAPHLIDFGLASRIDVQAGLSGSGSPLFMAPELFRGGEPSIGSDVYALGATLWTLISGRAPFAELGAGALTAKLKGTLPTHEACVGLRKLLFEAALFAMAPDRRARASSADELSARVERALRRSEPPLSRDTPKARFLAPRPRGREELLEEMDGAMGEALVLALHGERGMGKSTLLRELKWRAQLAGRRVFELRFGPHADSGMEQLRSQLGDAGTPAASARLPLDKVEELVRCLSASTTGEPSALLIDDLERGDTEFLRALPVALHELGKAAPTVLVTTQGLERARQRCELVIERSWSLPPLSTESAHGVVRDALGLVDSPLADALVAHAHGNPGLLVEALALVFARPDMTAEEVSVLLPGEIGDGMLRARFSQLSEAAQRALALLVAARTSVHAEIPESVLQELLGHDARRALAELHAQRLCQESPTGVRLHDAALATWLRHTFGKLLANVAAQALALKGSCALQAPILAELSLSAGHPERLVSVVDQALENLRREGALEQALGLARAAEQVLDASRLPKLRLQVAELEESLGQLDACVESARNLFSVEDEPHVVVGARLICGRAHVARGQLQSAVDVLSVLTAEYAGEHFAAVCRELSRVLLRRGDHTQAAQVVQRGLAACGPRDPARSELLALDATLVGLSGDRARADLSFAQALVTAQELGNERDRAQVLGYRAMAFDSAGDLTSAAETYEQAIVSARKVGDVGLIATYASNYGGVNQRLGRTDVAAENYALASRLLRRAGRFGMAGFVQTNLAFLHLYLGAFERARAIAEEALHDAEQRQLEAVQGQALHVLGDVAARLGETETALSRYDAAAGHFERVSRKRLLAEAWLDAAECLLQRAGASDVSAASARLARARGLIEAEGIEDLRTRLKFLLARARAAHGDLEGALGDLDRLARVELKEHEREIGWKVLMAQAELHRALGSEVLARRCTLDAAEIIEREASRVPRDARDGFRAEPRRRQVLEAAISASPPSPSRIGLTTSKRGERSASHGARLERLLEIIKRLAQERDSARLLERITDAAVELSGAERGFVLLLDPQGALAPHTVRVSAGREEDPSVAFSRSIAEAVLIDGEPIVTVNARDDRRVNEFMSVHKLMLKSVACVPIRGPVRVEGVLYLEHRMRAGRFQDEDVDLLLAFADQAAIALENMRLWQENSERSAALEAKNFELEQAKSEIERLLEARTEELEQAQRALSGARAALTEGALRHGMIGHGHAMRRVFSLIERVRDSSVPVVIQGESGTGKELVARAIHAAGARKKGAFVAVNCGALPEQLLESELFGHVRGAFTGAERDKKGLFQLAHGGTIFLDEFADVPPRMQLDLLRVLQEGTIRPLGAESDLTVDVRVIVAAKRPLDELVQEKSLREDLFYRLSVVELKLPPLRERTEDLPLLCEHLLARIASKHGGRPKRLTRAAFVLLGRQPFPGNVRQLEHVLLSAVMLSEGPSIEPRDLALDDAGGGRVAPIRARTTSVPADNVGGGDAFEGEDDREEDGLEPVTPGSNAAPLDVRGFKQRERQRILDALERHGWNRVKAATELGMPRRTFYRRLAEFGIL